MSVADVNAMVQTPDRRDEARRDLTALLAELG